MSEHKLEKSVGERLRILHIPKWYPSKKNPVAGVFVREHVKATAIYNDVVVLYSEGLDREIRGLYQIQDNIEDDIRTLRLRYRKSHIPKTTYFIYLWSIKQAFKRLLKQRWKPDIIHAHVYSAGVPGVILGKIYKIPVVITEHWSGFPLHKLCKLEMFKARFAMNRAKILLPVSKSLEKAIEPYGIKNNFQVVPNVVDTEIFYPSTSQHENERKRILFVALLSPPKGISYLLQALTKLKEKRQDFLLNIVGDGSNRQEYEELTEKLELGEMVRFHGLKSKPEVAEFMRRSDFFVLPSLYETFGVVLIEALACGKPVIATNIGGPNEIITQKVGKLVPPKDPEGLAEAIDYMLDHYQNYSPENISKYVKENFSYEVVGNKLNSVYRKIIKQL